MDADAIHISQLRVNTGFRGERLVDLTLELDASQCCLSDDLADTVK